MTLRFITPSPKGLSDCLTVDFAETTTQITKDCLVLGRAVTISEEDFHYLAMNYTLMGFKPLTEGGES